MCNIFVVEKYFQIIKNKNMKKLSIPIAFFLMQFSIQAQEKMYQKVEGTPKKVRGTPMQVDGNKGQILGTVINTGVLVTPPANLNAFPAKSVVRVLPDGRRMTVSMSKDVANIPTNIDGAVKESVLGENTTPQGMYDKKVITKTISAESNSFMDVNIANQSSRIFPGAIYDCASFFAGSMPMGNARNPFTIYSDNTNNTSGSLSAQVADGQQSSIYNAISSITTRFSNTVGSANLQYRSFRSFNDADLSIKISASGAYAGFSASGGYNMNTSETTLFLTIDAIKPMYSVSTQVPTNGYFTDPNVGAASNLMVINRVTYGSRILANLRVVIKTRKDAADFAARYGVSDATFVQASFGLVKNNNSVESSVNAYVVGGPMTTTTFNRDNLEQEIRALLTQCNYQTAQPISYSFTDLSGNQLGARSATDVFDEIITTPKDAIYRCTSAAVEISTSDDNKENGSNASISLNSNAPGLAAEQPNNNTEFPNNSMNNIGLLCNNNNDNLLLSNFTSGDNNQLHIFLEPKPIFFGFDAWKIRKVTLVLNFTDQFGNAYPAGPRRIEMNNSTATLEKNKQRLVCYFDRNFQSTNSSQPQ
jgi:hypothetical protein